MKGRITSNGWLVKFAALVSVAAVVSSAQVKPTTLLKNSMEGPTRIVPAGAAETPAKYTPEARAANLQGNVVLYIEVTQQGEPAQIRVIQSLGYGLDDQAVEVARGWRFVPAMKDGKAVKAGISAEVPFRLPGEHAWRIRRWIFSSPKQRDLEEDWKSPIVTTYSAPDSGGCGEARKQVVLFLDVSAKGVPERLRIGGSNDEAGSKVVLRAAAAWRFQPALARGREQSATGIVQIDCGGGESEPVSVPLRMGEDSSISAPTVQIKLKPSYSVEAQRAGKEGFVLLSGTIYPDGHAREIYVVKELGLGLDEQAMATLIQWLFLPGRKDGKAVPVKSTFEVNFKLR